MIKNCSTCKHWRPDDFVLSIMRRPLGTGWCDLFTEEKVKTIGMVVCDRWEKRDDCDG